jgi:hypothetical protein
LRTQAAGRMKDVETLSKELSTMKRELEDVKEILKGLIRVIMSKEGELDEDEYN